MPLIQCLLGATTQHVLGHNYVFNRDRAGRFVAEVKPEHKHVFIAVQHYKEVEPLPDPDTPRQEKATPKPNTKADSDSKADAPEILAIKGIGKALAAKLEPFGITTFAAIAALSDDQVSQLDEALNLKGAITRDKWIEQAKALVPPATHPPATQEPPAGQQG